MNQKALFQRFAEMIRDRMVERIRRGEGVNGRLHERMKPRSDGLPLGGRLPEVIQKATITVQPDGFTLEWPDSVGGYALDGFHYGGPNQIPRPVIGTRPQDDADMLAMIALARVGGSA